jgi:hypothetical protein
MIKYKATFFDNRLKSIMPVYENHSAGTGTFYYARKGLLMYAIIQANSIAEAMRTSDEIIQRVSTDLYILIQRSNQFN